VSANAEQGVLLSFQIVIADKEPFQLRNSSVREALDPSILMGHSSHGQQPVIAQLFLAIQLFPFDYADQA
jgi:hypothetical protein